MKGRRDIFFIKIKRLWNVWVYSLAYSQAIFEAEFLTAGS